MINTLDFLTEYRQHKNLEVIPDEIKSKLILWFERNTSHSKRYRLSLIMDILIWCNDEMRNNEMLPPHLRNKYFLEAAQRFALDDNEIRELYIKHYSIFEKSILNKTKIIAFEGIDGSGKTLQINLLAQYLQNSGYSTKTKSFPVYSSFFGKQIGELLSDHQSQLNANTVDPKSMSLWYGLDRWHSFYNEGIEQNDDFLLLNRYTMSSAVYQSIRHGDVNQREEVGDWIIQLEHEFLNLPKPDLYVVFDVPTEISQSNVESKGHRDYVGERADVYEESELLQEQARKEYKRLSDKLGNVAFINSMLDTKNMKNEQTIHFEVVEALKQWGILNTIV